MTEKLESFTSEQKRTLLRYALALVLCVAAVVAANLLFKSPSAEELLAQHRKGKSEILGMFQTRAQIATTEVKLKRLGIYQSDTDFGTLNPAKWKLGSRTCIVPVEITIKYGIDMRKMQDSDIELDSVGSGVKIRLPHPEIIDYSFDLRTNRDDVIAVNSFTREVVGDKTIQAVKMKVVDEVLADSTLFQKLAVEIDNNTRLVFRSMLKGIGLEPQFVN